MAPYNYPEEVDVFTIPHSRMKNLVHKYCDMLSKTNFSSQREFEFLLNNLRNTFNEFRCHELIENKFIMKKLKRKLKELSIKNAAVCNCHKDNQLKEMVEMFKGAAEWRQRSKKERIMFGMRLRNTLEEFTEHFLPHMKEEEEVFQPLLMKYFTYEELRTLKSQVISEHENWNWKYCWDEKKLQESDDTEEDDDLCGDSAVDLPPEILVKIFSNLNVADLCRAARVSRAWNDSALDNALWRHINPVQWAKGDWRWQEATDGDEALTGSSSDDESCPDVYIKDEDADLDESEDSDTSSQRGLSVSRTKREYQILQALCKHVLPRVGAGVRYVNLAHSRGLTNGALYQLLKLCPNIEKLTLSHTKVSDFGFKGMEVSEGGGNLRIVDLSGCANIRDKSLKRLFSSLSTIKTFKQCYNCGEKTSYCPENEKIDNLSDGRVMNEYRTEIQVVKLEYLSLSGCHMVTNAGLRAVGAGLDLPHLKTLDLSGLPNISSLALEALVTRCPNLNFEELSYCDNITNGPMAALANGCQNVDCPSRSCCRHYVGE